MKRRHGTRSETGIGRVDVDAILEDSNTASTDAIKFIVSRIPAQKGWSYRNHMVPSSTRHRSSETQAGSNKKPRKDKDFARLAALGEFPIDVFMHIAENLRPFDLLNLSRVSKRYHSIFAARSALPVWCSAITNVSLPKCPSDLTPMQYASLLFDKLPCQHCGETQEVRQTDWGLRLVLCSHCVNVNVFGGSDIVWDVRMEKIMDLFVLLPPSTLKHGTIPPLPVQSNAFYKGDVTLISKKWLALASNDEDAWNIFLSNQKALIKEIIGHARQMSRWTSGPGEKWLKDGGKAHDRMESIRANLIAEGWNTDLIDRSFLQYLHVANQPRLLTPRIWTNIKSEVEAHLNKTLRDEEAKQLWKRLRARKAKLKAFYDAWFLQQTLEERATLPYADDVYAMLEDLLDNDSDKLDGDESSEVLQNSLPTLRSRIQAYRIAVKHQFARLLLGTTGSAEELSVAEIDEMLEVPWALFQCGCCNPLSIPLSANVRNFRDMLHHDVYNPAKTSYHQRTWQNRLELVKPVTDSQKICQAVLRTMDMSPDLSGRELNSLKFICPCGNPNFGRALDFKELICHVATENLWYKDACERKASVSELAAETPLFNDHGLDSPHFQLFHPSNSDSLGSDSSKTLDRYSRPHHCLICLGLRTTLRAHSHLDSRQDAEYHMSSKHHKDLDKEDISVCSDVYCAAR